MDGMMTSASTDKANYLFSFLLGLVILALLVYAIVTGEINDLDKYSATKISLAEQPAEFWTTFTIFSLINVVVFIAAFWSRKQMLSKIPPGKRGAR